VRQIGLSSTSLRKMHEKQNIKKVRQLLHAVVPLTCKNRAFSHMCIYDSYDCHNIVVCVPQYTTNRLVLLLKAQCVFCNVVAECYSNHFQGLVDYTVLTSFSFMSVETYFVIVQMYGDKEKYVF
jgi:hypothetical protein